MASTWKTVRVFISSTFRDMHAERDWLVKRVFPALREKLQKYRIYLVDIDLRWGVTEEEAEKDRVLDLCLSQIHECQPFFVGILGERYGWVPDHFTEEAKSKNGWVQHQTGKSVTELEILHGVLNDPAMRGNGMFCFRDPAFIDSVPEAKRADMLAENNENSDKLADLKKAILDTDLPFEPFDGYPCQYAGLRINWQLASRDLKDEAEREALRKVAEDGIVGPDEYEKLDDHLRQLVHRFGVVHLDGLEDFGRRVSKYLWEAIKREHKLPDTPTSLAEADPLAEEAGYHEEFMESRLRVYVGRQELQNELTTFADGDATHPCLVTGRSGSGKSAVLARFARDYARAHPATLLIPHFVGASPDSTSLRLMLQRFCMELQPWVASKEEEGREDGVPEAAPVEIPQDTNGLITTLRELLNRVPRDERVVVVVDALNQLDETDNAHSMHWLPWELPPQVKFVVSCIDDTPEEETGSERSAMASTVSSEEPTESVLKSLAQRPHKCFGIEPLTKEEQLRIVFEVPSLSAKKLDEKQIGLLLDNPATKNPLFLLVALEELRGFGVYEQVAERIAAFPHDDDDPVGALFGQVITRLREEFDPEVVRTVLALIACSRKGMSQRELLEMIEGIDVEQSSGDLFPVLRQLRPYMQHRGELLDFFHRGLYKAVRDRYLPDEERGEHFHSDLAKYFHVKLNPPAEDLWSGNYVRALSELPYHQTKGRLWKSLETTLTDLPFLEAKTAAGWGFELVGDYSSAVAAMPKDRPSHRVLWLLEEALRRDVHFIAQHSEDYPQALFQCLWNTCWWYDCDEAAAHYEEPEDGWALGNAPWKRSEEGRLCLLMERWYKSRERSSGSFRWLRSQRPPSLNLGTAQRAVFRGHENQVTSLAFSQDGQRIVSGSADGTVRLWDAKSGAELAVFREEGVRWVDVSFRPDGRPIACGWLHLGGEAVYICDPQCGETLAVLRENNFNGSAISHSPDGRQIVTGSLDGTVRVWDVSSGDRLLVLREDEGNVHSVSYSPDGRRILSRSHGRVHVWDAENGNKLEAVLSVSLESLPASFRPEVLRWGPRESEDGYRVQPESDAELARLAVLCSERVLSNSMDGRRIATQSVEPERPVRIWDVESGNESTVLHGHGSTIACVSFSPDGRWIVGAASDNTLRIWDLQGEYESVRWLKGHRHEVTSVSYSPNGRRFATGGTDRTARIWDAEKGCELAVLPVPENTPGLIPSTQVLHSSDGRRMLVNSNHEGIQVWDAERDAKLTAFTPGERTGKTECISFNPGGLQIACAVEHEDCVQVWDAESGSRVAVLRGGDISVYSLAYHPDGQELAIGLRDATVRLWDTSSWKESIAFSGHGHMMPVTAVAYSPDGRHIASGSDDSTVRIWAQTGDVDLADLDAHKSRVEHLSLSPDGLKIAAGDRTGKVRVWDPSYSEELDTHLGHTLAVNTVSYSPDGRQIASGSADRTVRLWDARTTLWTRIRSVMGCRKVTVLHGHEGSVESVAHSPDGRRIASGSTDGTVRTWNSRNGKALSVLSGHEDTVNSVSYSPDGQRIVSGSSDMTVRVWNAENGAQVFVLSGHNRAVNRVSYSKDGRVIVSSHDDKGLRAWDAKTGAELTVRGRTLAVLHARGAVKNVLYSSDGQRVISRTKHYRPIARPEDNVVQVWDAKTHQCLEVIEGPCDLAAMVWSELPRRAVCRSMQIVIEPTGGGPPVAWLPVASEIIATRPDGHSWTVAVGNYLCTVTLSESSKDVASEKSCAGVPDKRNLDVASRIGRNDPCPCGSGKKFKKCCGRTSTQEKRVLAKETADDLREDSLAQPDISFADGFFTCTVTVNLNCGFGPLRCVTQFVEECRQYEGQIRMAREDRADMEVDAKDIMQCLMLAAEQGTRIVIRVEGQDDAARQQSLRLVSALIGGDSDQLDFSRFL